MISVFAIAALASAAEIFDEQAAYLYVPIPNASETPKFVTTHDHLIKYTVDMQLVGQGRRCYCGYDDYKFFELDEYKEQRYLFRGMQSAYLNMCEQTFWSSNNSYPDWEEMTNTWNLRSPNSRNTSAFCSQGRRANETEPRLTTAQAIARCAAEPQCHGFQRGIGGQYTLETMINEPQLTRFFSMQPTGTQSSSCQQITDLRQTVLDPSQCYRKQRVTATAMKKIDAGSGLAFRDVYIDPSNDKGDYKGEAYVTIAFAFFGVLSVAFLTGLLFRKGYSRLSDGNAGYMSVLNTHL